MILTASAIQDQHWRGRLTLDPFESRQLNPNSYNYRLGRVLFEAVPGGSGTEIVKRHDLSLGAQLLRPRRSYLGHTFERIGSTDFVTLLGGRSSMGRLGLFLNFSADLGHTGAVHCWTLEITVVQPVWVTFGMQVGQASFWDVLGGQTRYSGHLSRTDLPAGVEYSALRAR